MRNLSAHQLAKKKKKNEKENEEETQDLFYKALLFLFIENVQFKSLQNKNKLENLSCVRRDMTEEELKGLEGRQFDYRVTGTHL